MTSSVIVQLNIIFSSLDSTILRGAFFVFLTTEHYPMEREEESGTTPDRLLKESDGVMVQLDARTHARNTQVEASGF